MPRLPALTAVLMLAVLSACGGGGKAEKPPYPGIKLGKPYEISGRWYEPHYNPRYDEIGTASWYGPGFHGGHTANGERYDQEEMTAAHRTLPLPSIVRVTNLDNGRSALIRVNDRGPFAHDRIIDLSHAAADRLGVIRSGTAKVRVQFLDAETRQFVQNWQEHGFEYADNVLKGISPQLASSEPQLRIETKTFGRTPEEQLAMDSGARAPLPPTVSVTTEPAPSVLKSPVPQAEPETRREILAEQKNEEQYDDQPDIFSVVDDTKPHAAVASYEPAQTYAPKPVPRLAPATGTLGAAQPGHGFFVQAGTFGVEGNAQRLMARVETYGASQVMEIVANGHKLYRVMMGPYSAQNDAKNMLSKLAGLGISDAKIIRN